MQLLLNQVAVARVGQDEAQQLALLERDRLKAVNDLVTAAENELALLGAETELARDLLIIEQELAALRGDPNNNFSEEDIARIKQARTNLALAKEEQRQYNELLAAAQPFADAFATGLTSGLQEVVAGTKTAEEAFADFLKNIADLLVQTAATMIAQYIAIGIARAFAGIPLADGKTDTKTLTPIIQELAQGVELQLLLKAVARRSAQSALLVSAVQSSLFQTSPAASSATRTATPR